MIYPEQLVTSITTIAIAITKDKSEKDIAVIGMIFDLLGDTIRMIAVQKAIVERTCGPKEIVDEEILDEEILDEELEDDLIEDLEDDY